MTDPDTTPDFAERLVRAAKDAQFAARTHAIWSQCRDATADEGARAAVVAVLRELSDDYPTSGIAPLTGGWLDHLADEIERTDR